MRKFKTYIDDFVSDESGATAIEYGLIAALISLGIITVVTQIGGNLGDLFTNITTRLLEAMSSSSS